MKRCPYCSGAIRGRFRVCPHCGSELRRSSRGTIIAIFLTITVASGAYLYLLGEDGRARLLRRSHQRMELVEGKFKALLSKKWTTKAEKKFASKSENKVERQFRGEVEIKLFESGKLSRGMTKNEVRSLLGKPEYQKDPIGNPPIERWGYPDQVVVFESGYVIDSFYRK